MSDQEGATGDGDFYSPPYSVTIPAANTRCAVKHGLGVVPDGVDIVDQPAGANIGRVAGVPWTTTLAYLESSVANAHAVVRFRVLRQRPRPAPR